MGPLPRAKPGSRSRQRQAARTCSQGLQPGLAARTCWAHLAGRAHEVCEYSSFAPFLVLLPWSSTGGGTRLHHHAKASTLSSKCSAACTDPAAAETHFILDTPFGARKRCRACACIDWSCSATCGRASSDVTKRSSEDTKPV